MALSDFHKTIGRASQFLLNIDADFEKACLSLMLEAFRQMKQEGRYDLTWKETRISACLIGHMRKIRNREDIALQIDPESYLYREEILEGEEDPDTAPRIDIKILGMWVHEDVYYGIEGKVLVENNWRSRDSSKLRARYIDTGIDNFVNGRYSSTLPRGCIAGYVVQGTAAEIVVRINDLLERRGRQRELLIVHHYLDDHPDCYQSRHIRTTDKNDIRLCHVFLTFC
jgi:hypothetical protein